MKKSAITVPVLALGIFSFFVSAAFAAEAVADYRRIMTGMAEYAAAKQKYNKLVTNAKFTLEEQTKTAKNDLEKQNLLSSYTQYCKEQERAIFEPLIGKMKYVLQQIANEKGYTKVYTKGEGSGTDITQEAIARLNAVYVPKTAKPIATPADKKETVAVVQKVPNPEVHKTVKTEALPKQEVQKISKAKSLTEPKRDTVQRNIQIQFGAGYNKGAINTVVARAVQNGINTAYIAEAKDKYGKTLWRARATADSDKDARELSARLSHMGLRNFILK